MIRQGAYLITLCLSGHLFLAETCVQAQMVSYNGGVTQNGAPVANGFVIAGTFAPGFDVDSYKYVYGDESGNLLGLPHYSQAVADGNFRPIGDGALTLPDGSFAGSGSNETGVGRLVYLFAFDKPNPADSWFFAMATNPAWVTGSDSFLNISADEATQFPFGEKFGATLGLQIMPFPEPSSLSLAIVVGSALLVRVRHHRH